MVTGRSQAVALAATLGAFAVVPRSMVENGPVICPLHRFTGLPCPGCGLTRSLSRFAHADVHGAVQAHPIGPLLYLAVAALVVGLLVDRGATPRSLARRALRSPLLRAAGLAAATVWAVWATARLGRAAA